jgi:chemotaxis signal transduction protein
VSQDPQEARQFVVIAVQGVSFGIPIESVVEIMQVPEITRTVNARPSLPGMFDFRGHVVAVVDCRSALGFPTGAIDERSRVVVLSHAGQQLGLLVDAVIEVTTVQADALETPQGGRGVSPLVVAVAHLEDGLMLEIDWVAAIEAAIGGAPAEVPAEYLRAARGAAA